MITQDVNFITDDCTEREKDVLFGPLTSEDVWITFTKDENIGHLLRKAGLIKSLSWARQNGWDKVIPEGFTAFTFGKLKHKITIFNKVIV